MAYIYCLVDPISNELRYVGYTAKTLEWRLETHWRERKRSSTHKNNWIKSLWDEYGVKPNIICLEEVSVSEWEEAENFWINYFNFIGSDLTNGTVGGLGRKKGSKLSEEHKRKISEGLYKALEAGTFKPTGDHLLGKPSWNKGVFGYKTNPQTGLCEKGKKRPWQDGEKNCQKRRKEFTIYNRDTGEYVTSSGVRKFCRERGLPNHQNLSAVINGKQPSYMGWIRCNE
jgi:surface antigen